MAIGLSKRTIDLDGSTVIARTGKAVQTGTQAEHDAYTGELGEITYNTTDDRLHAHDGVTAGGFPLSRESELTASDVNIADNVPAGAEITFAAGLATVASAGVAVKLVAVTAVKGQSIGFTVGTDNTLTPTFTNTRLCRIRGRFLIDIASGTDNVTLHVNIAGGSNFQTAAQSVTAGAAKLFEFDFLFSLATGWAIEVFAENEDTTVNIDSAVAAERADTVPAHGFIQITGA